jgi:serine/threonine-protein kinase HipA
VTAALNVFWDHALVGRLGLDDHGDMNFSYASGWLEDPTKPAISASLPKRPESFGRREARSFFAGLLPEEAQREGAARALGVSKGNDFALLDAMGGDVAGALVLWPEGSEPPAAPIAFMPRQLDDAALAALLEELPRRPLLAGNDGLRLSLAGAQLKLPVVLIDGQVALPAPGQPTTHILKPPIEHFEGTTENEAFCLRLAAAVGLSVAPVAPRRTGDKSYLLIERYDRAVAADGSVRRLHQEDFCQALGIAPERKYASEGGPNFRSSFDLVRRICARPSACPWPRAGRTNNDMFDG